MKKVILWKIYFWIILVLVGLGVLATFVDTSNLKAGDWSSLVEGVILTAGIFSFVFAKKIFSNKVWQVIFFLLIGVLILDTIHRFAPSAEIKQLLSFRAVEEEVPLTFLLIGQALFIPAYYTIYQLAFKNKYLYIPQKIDKTEESKGFKRTNVIWMIILTIITLGLYVPFWFIRQREAINNLHSPEKLYKNTFVTMFILSLMTLIVSILSPIVLRLIGYEGIGKDIDYIIKWINLIPGVILLFQIFKVRRIFIDHFNDYLKKDIWFSGLLTFLFHIYYFQYLINKHTRS